MSDTEKLTEASDSGLSSHALFASSGEHHEQANYRKDMSGKIMVGVICPRCGAGGANPITYQPKCLPCDTLMLPSGNKKAACEWDTFLTFIANSQDH
jgi:hypothetical protein